MAWNRKPKSREREPLLTPKWGQVVIAALLLASIVLLANISISSLQSHDLERQQIMSEESDASAMIFVQRESFNTIIAVRDWSEGIIGARDVQIARALLGQRLQVVTSSGNTTYSLTSQLYRQRLRVVDGLVRQLSEVPDTGRSAFVVSHSTQLDQFRDSTIQLNAQFQKLSRAQILAVADARAASELWQAFILFAILLLGLVLSAWLTMDIVKNYRRISRDLKDQRGNLEVAGQRLHLLHRLENYSAIWLELINDGAASAEVIARIRADVTSLMPTLVLDFVSNPQGEIELVTREDQNLPDDATQTLSRAQEALHVMSSRDQHLRMISEQRDFDQLTQLPNRSAFSRAVDVAVRSAESNDRVVGLLLMDIDRFRDVNASLGYGFGDELLIQVARRLLIKTQGREQAARLSADEFGVILTGRTATEVESRARALLRELDFTTELAGHSAQVSVSGGLGLLAPDDPKRGDISRWAAMAIYLAKAPGERGQFVAYSPQQHEALLNTWYEELAVRNALRSGEFRVYFQPIVSIQQSKVIGFEALVRWERPGFGLVYPNDFLPLVQRAGITVELGWQILENALSAWRKTIGKFGRAGDQPYIAINVDAIQLADSNFAEFVIASIQRNQVDAKCVVIEVTERSLVEDGESLSQLRQLADYGLKIAIDDFGTGYNNLGQVHALPLNVIKVDRTFLGADSISTTNQAIIRDIIKIATSLGATIVVEGVETEKIESQLRDLGIELAQGFLYSPAMPEDQMRGWVDSFNRFG